jgi:kynurenine formamidase
MRIVDLTHPFNDEMPVYPGLATPAFRDLAEVEVDGYAISEWRFINHTGTHIDAPAHMEAGGARLDEIPLERLVCEAVTIDVSGRDPGPITVDELEPLVADVRDGDTVLVFSDNARHYGSDAYWTGWSYPDEDASRLLLDRGVSAIGFDGPSADPIDTTGFELHHLWLGAGRMILENLTNLGELPSRTQIVIAPMKVSRANGAPIRVFALNED